MKDTRWRLFSYLVIDHKAAQADLNAMAEQGWELEKLWTELPLAKFRRTERTDLRYFVDWADTAKPEESAYLQLCKDAGWELVHTQGYRNVYASTPGCAPLPIQTDPELEYQRFRKKVVRRIAMAAVLPQLPWVVYFFWLFCLEGAAPPAVTQMLRSLFLSSNGLSLFLLTLPLLLPALLVYGLCMAGQLLVWRRAVREGTSPQPSLPAARRRGLLTLLAQPYFLLLAVLLFADILFNGLGNIGLPIGIFVGGGIRWYMYGHDPRIRRQLVKLFAAAGAMLLCFCLHGPVQDLVPGRIPTGGVLTQAVSVREDYHTDTFLGSKASWREYCGEDRRWVNSVSFQAQVWTTPALAERFQTPPGEEMLPLEGYDSVWYASWNKDDEGTFLLRRGTAQLTVRYRAMDGQTALEAALAWLEAFV